MSGPEAHRDQPDAADTAISGVPARAAAGTAPPPVSGGRPRVEHPTGPTDAGARLATGPDGRAVVRRTAVVRAARELVGGIAFPRPSRTGPSPTCS